MDESMLITDFSTKSSKINFVKFTFQFLRIYWLNGKAKRIKICKEKVSSAKFNLARHHFNQTEVLCHIGDVWSPREQLVLFKHTSGNKVLEIKTKYSTKYCLQNVRHFIHGSVWLSVKMLTPVGLMKSKFALKLDLCHALKEKLVFGGTFYFPVSMYLSIQRKSVCTFLMKGKSNDLRYLCDKNVKPTYAKWCKM